MDIRVERRASGLTQAALARAAAVPQPNLSAYENGRRTPSPDVLARIRSALQVRPSVRVEAQRAAMHEVISRHRASAPRVFGSVARGEDEPGSDLDLLVDFAEDASLFDEIGLRLDLVELLGIQVDVIDAASLQGSFRNRVLAEAVPL